jgi:uncharacterized protein (TIGR03067 family)
MNRVFVGVVVSFVAALLASGGQCDEKAAQADLARLQGEWAMVSGEIQGEAMPEGWRTTARRVAKENETTVTVGGQLFMKARFKLDPTKTPKTIDYEMTGGPTEGKKQLGIYEFDGEQVRFCFGSPDKDRPTEFKTAAGDGRTLSVWKPVPGIRSDK